MAYTEIVHANDTLVLTDGGTVPIIFVFDCQARPHIVLTCPALTGLSLGIAPPRKPSYWDLPTATQAQLLHKQLACGRAAASDLGLSETAIRATIHLGEWVTGRHIHAHIQLPTQPYYRLLAATRGDPEWSADECAERAAFVAKLRQDNKRFHAMDLPALRVAAASLAPPPDVTALTAPFRAVTYDPKSEGAAAIDVTFVAPILHVQCEPLTQVLHDLNAFVHGLGVKGCFYLFPAPGCMTGDTARVVILPGKFISLLPIEARAAWAEKWAVGDPVQRACCENLMQLSPPRRICSFYLHAKCTHGDSCRYLHPPSCSHYLEGKCRNRNCRFARPPAQAPVCPYYLRGKCTYGDGCCFQHPPSLAPVCSFHKKGKCAYGARCHFLHQ